MSDVLFESGSIRITKSVAKFGSETYPVTNITSVGISESYPYALLGIIVALGGMFWAGYAIGAGAGILVLAGGLYVTFKRLPKKYSLTIRTSGSDVTVFTSKDYGLVDKAREALETAFIR
ncbi:MAG TPA: DUF6232 family protein [Sphingobium sp.]|nr:DUF6232 family protein [Sphingobium sp.]